MEFLCRSALSLPVMSVSVARVTTRDHGLVAIPGGKRSLPSGKELESVSSFLPEVSSSLPSTGPAQANPENAQGRVFLEIFLILGVAGSLAIAAFLWTPASP